MRASSPARLHATQSGPTQVSASNWAVLDCPVPSKSVRVPSKLARVPMCWSSCLSGSRRAPTPPRTGVPLNLIRPGQRLGAGRLQWQRTWTARDTGDNGDLHSEADGEVHSEVRAGGLQPRLADGRPQSRNCSPEALAPRCRADRTAMSGFCTPAVAEVTQRH